MTRARRTFLAIAFAAIAMTAAVSNAFAKAAPDNPYTMAIIGDTPYSATQIANFPYDIDDLNADPKVRFVMHLGDIKSGSTQCTDAYFQSIRAQFDRLEDSLVYTPGDNEWTDCHRANNGAFNPLERLQKLREVFFDRPNHTLGQRSVHVSSQASLGLPENVRWQRRGVQFGVINLPGSNDSLVPWVAPQGDGVHVGVAQQAEHDARLAANLNWLEEIFQRAKCAHARAIVIGLQADMFDPAAAAANQLTAYAPIVHKLAVKAAAWGRPVLLLNGDSHVYEADHPFAAGQQAGTIYGELTAAPNVTRVTVNGSTTTPHEWLRLQISQTDPNVFSWSRVPFTHQ